MPKKRYSIKRDSLDARFSKFVRSRDEWKCQRCNRFFEEGERQGLHCSHYFGRRKGGTRFDPANCDSLCFGCHQFFSENKAKYETWKALRLGKNNLYLLEMRATSVKPDREMVKLWLKKKGF